MAMFDAEETRFLEAMSALTYGNPFLPTRIEAEKAVLGSAFKPLQSVWNVRPDLDADTANVQRIGEKCEAMAPRLRARWTEASDQATPIEHEWYRDWATYVAYYRFHDRFLQLGQNPSGGREGQPAPFFPAFTRELHELLHPAHAFDTGPETNPVHLFACFYQVRRAFSHIFHFIVGGSMAAAKLRAAVWQSVFTHDMKRYRRSLFDRMHDISVLITGPSGTGKELVARAIAMSGYIPFDPKTQRFTATPENQFIALNPSALSPTLIEAELFGHRKGAYTGATADHRGWLEKAGARGTVFLDEIGELGAGIQVKLLRVLETRIFQRLGDTESRRFEGKFVAATHRDLSREIREGRFRSDLYYRICSDMIRTPSLREHLSENPDELNVLIAYLARRLLPDEEAHTLAEEVATWIDGNMPPSYPWPGNVRELDQCVRNILVRKHYAPAPLETHDTFFEDFAAGTLSAEAVLQRYCTTVYAMTGNYQETARRLRVDHRTVKAKIDPELLQRLRETS